jgi:hypothetical protein
VPQEIPSWRKLKEKFVKASFVCLKLSGSIDIGESLGSVNLLDRASEGFGLADNHQYAASIIVPTGKKLTLIGNAEKLIGLS